MNARELFSSIRAYSMPMSILNWLVAFLYVSKYFPESNIFYGELALIGIIFAHMGTNLFDDYIDFIFKGEKQEFKTRLLREGKMTSNMYGTGALLCFLVSSLIGLFFIFKYGTFILWLCTVAGLIILLYPRLNHYALGDIAVGLNFGPLLFTGVNYVMTGVFDWDIVLISIPVGLFTMAVVYVHNYLDFNFDKENNKKTLCVRLGSKKTALIVLFCIYTLALIFTSYLASVELFGRFAHIAILLFFFILQFLTKLNSSDDFVENFAKARDISALYNLILVLGVIW